MNSIINWENEIDNFIEDYYQLGFDHGPNADEYFVDFRIRNKLNIDHNPFKQIKVYKKLLKELQDKYPYEYKKIHKGTPFFWIGWYSFLAEYYNQAVFYIDAAMSEDKINHKTGDWLDSGAAMFFRLKLTNYQVMFRSSSAPELNEVLKKEFKRFNLLNLNNNINLENFVEDFIENKIYHDNTAIITTLYTFILEKNRIMEMLHNKGDGGTIEPMIMHIFKGALIFDTLLKEKHGGDMLGTTLNNCKSIYSFDFNKCTPDSFNDIFNYTDNNNKQTAICITYKLRNKTAHKLDWHDSFNESNYEKVYQNIWNAIFFVIQNEYL